MNDQMNGHVEPDTSAADEIALLAEQAEREDGQTDTGTAHEAEWEDVDAMDEQTRAVARMMVQGAEFAAGLIHPGHALGDEQRRHGEEVMFPVARDFSGELPEWLKPYMHYLGAGMWLGGVMVGAYKAKMTEQAERARREQAEQPTEQGEGAPYGSPA